jgi:hypothetical protein
MPTLTMNRVHQAPIAKEIIGCSTAGTEAPAEGRRVQRSLLKHI